MVRIPIWLAIVLLLATIALTLIYVPVEVATGLLFITAAITVVFTIDTIVWEKKDK